MIDIKIGINILLWTGKPCFSKDEALLERIKEMGFDCVELSVGGLSASEVNQYAKKALSLGLEPQCADLFTASEADIIGHDAGLRNKAVTRLKESILKTRDMGATLLSGPFFQGLCGSTQIGPTSEEWGWAVENLRACAVFAKAHGVRLAGEPLNRFEMHIVNTISDAYRLCAETGCDNMGILADTHHSNIEELDIVESYIKHIDRIFNIHISENNRGIPGSGHAIPTALFGALKTCGYKGNLVIEAFNANVKETLPLLRIWRPFADTEDEIALEGLRFIKSNL